ncbi:transglutaminase domain-containing protein [Dokdonia sp.]|uniref:transglutaminase domain-containing protein n=1 Tax=Dokdonia sp. TaxID=2024995 RepID=UPI003267B73F
MVLFYAFAKAQTPTSIEEKVRTYPKSIHTIKSLSDRIQHDFSTKETQTRAIYTWIATNIAYDLIDYYSLRSPNRIYYYSEEERVRKIREAQTALINKTLQTKKGLCEGYATLFHVLCEELGIPSVIINGYTKTDSKLIGTSPGFKNHAWNAVYLNDQWHLIDVTWGAGQEIEYRRKWQFQFNESYYKVAPEIFVKHHYPQNPIWQLIESPITKEDFFKKPLFYSSYFSSGAVLSDAQNGTILLSKNTKYIYLHFEEVPKDRTLYYTTQANKEPRKVRIKQHPKGGFTAKIKVTERYPITLTIYNKQEAIIDFKVESNYN